MSGVKIRRPTDAEVQALGVEHWGVWTCEPSTFDWEYDATETFYVLEGKVRVKTPDGEVAFGAGNLVTFPKGMKCIWTVLEPVRKRYTFDE